MKNYIFGIGYFANRVEEQFSKIGVRINGLLELKETYMPIYIEPNKNVPTYYLDDESDIDKSSNIIIAQKPIIMGDTIAFLRRKGFSNIYIVNEEILHNNCLCIEDIMKYCYKLDLNMPFLNYLEMNVVDHCNLNCKGCAHFSNICDNGYVSIESFENDIKLIAKNFNLYYFRILGGEPLLHPNILEIMKIARDNLPNTNIVVVTNGLLINKLSPEILQSFVDNNITICISLYEPTYHIIEQIMNRLNSYKINYILNDDYTKKLETIKTFQTRLTDIKDNNGEKVSKMCIGRFCRFLRDGKISKCYYPLLIDILNKKCKKDFVLQEKDYIELKNISNGWEAIEQLNNSIPFCDYCCEEVLDFSWESGHKNDNDVYQYILKK